MKLVRFSITYQSQASKTTKTWAKSAYALPSHSGPLCVLHLSFWCLLGLTQSINNVVCISLILSVFGERDKNVHRSLKFSFKGNWNSSNCEGPCTRVNSRMLGYCCKSFPFPNHVFLPVYESYCSIYLYKDLIYWMLKYVRQSTAVKTIWWDFKPVRITIPQEHSIDP